MRRGALVLAVAALAASAGWGGPTGASSHDVRDLPFQLVAAKIRGVGVGEPAIALSSKDHIFVCGPTGIPGGGMTYWRSEDWLTFERQTINDRLAGGDCHVAVGPDGAVYTANLQGWGSAIRKSFDDGRTFDQQASEDVFIQDRQWLATDPADPNVVYLAYHDLFVVGAVYVAKSIDGGKTFPIHSLVSSDPVIMAGSARQSFPGLLRVDPTDHNRLYMVWAISSTEECLRDPGGCPGAVKHTLVVGRSEDAGLTWTNHIAMTSPPGSDLGKLIPWISLDLAGNVYVTAAGQIDGTNGLFLAASTDRGQHWTGPVKVNAGAGAAVFPTVAAGADGLVDFAWLESTAPTTSTGTWTVRFAQSRNAHDAAPSFTEVTGPIVHSGEVCVQGVGCILGGDRRLLDFMDMAIDRFGYAHMVTASTVGGIRVLYWRQDAGPSVYSEPCVPQCVTVRPGPIP